LTTAKDFSVIDIFLLMTSLYVQTVTWRTTFFADHNDFWNQDK